MPGSPGTVVITGVGPGPEADTALPPVIVRRRGTSTTYGSVLEPYRGQPRVQEAVWVHGSSADAIGVAVRRDDRTRYLVTSTATHAVSLGELRFHAAWRRGRSRSAFPTAACIW